MGLRLARVVAILAVAAAIVRSQSADPPPGSDDHSLRDLLEPPKCPPGAPCTGGSHCDAVESPLRSVNLFSGEVVIEKDDLFIEGRGLDFVWRRTYRSRASPRTALGTGWDFSYNVYLVRAGPGSDQLLLHDGAGRVDSLTLEQPNVWAQDEFFRELHRRGDGSFVMVFDDSGEWWFHALDGSPQEGKLERIMDRNGNRLLLSYDAAGRLALVTDTLGRDIVVGYNAGGRLATVTDFTGRTVRYRYHGANSTTGAPGDLESAASPKVVGTPNGNDFPNGKVTRYTSSKGLADDALNHNLLSVTDPNGRTWFSVAYAPATSPSSIDFDHAALIQWGGPGDLIALHYAPQLPRPENGHAVVKAIVNDRVGNVGEYAYDAMNRLVMAQRFTGRAVPGVPVTDSSNRPTGKLRPSDPDFFETRYEYNVDSLVARAIYPNLDERHFVHEVDLDPQAARRARGNLRERRFLAGPLGADQPVHVELFEYDPGFGGCCDSNFVTRYTDANGNVVQHFYDDRGNRLQTIHAVASVVENWEYNRFGQVTAHVWPDNGSGHRQRDEQRYYFAGTQRGYLRERVVDAGGLAHTIRFERNAVGVLTRVIDARGADSIYIVNALDQAVRKISRETALGSGIRFARDYRFDGNDNIVRVDVENRDENGQLRANSHFTRTTDYEILNRTIRESTEVVPGHEIVEESEYDANRNLVLRRHGEAVNGNQPGNIVRSLYDERDLSFRTVRGAGAPEQSTDQYDYDGNGHLVQASKGLEGTPRVHLHSYDGFGRRVRTVDPMGNELFVSFDGNGNPTHSVYFGELDDVAGSSGNTRLFEESWIHDPMDRVTQRDLIHFDPVTQAPIGDGIARTGYEWSDRSELVRLTDDNGNVTTTTYDRANRRSVVTDAKGNSTTFIYDENSNVLSVTEREKSDLGGADQVFVTAFAYDGLDRRLTTTDNLGHVERDLLDSRGLPAARLDPRANVTRFRFDGAERIVERTHVLTDTGTGAGNVIGAITLLTGWDDSSRRVSSTDANGNVTRWDYDALSRKVKETLADGKSSSWTYDVHDVAVAWITPDGNLIQDGYDGNRRLVARSIALAPGFGGTTVEAYGYDGRNQRVRAQDDDSLATFEHDSLSNVLRETLNGRVTTCAHDGVHNDTQCTFPGGRSITRSYDAANLLRTITGDSLLAVYDYEGRRVARRTYPRPNAANVVRSVYAYDGDRRVTRVTHLRDPAGAGTLLEDRTFAWDEAGNKTSRDNLLAGGWLHDYAYDSVNRLVRTTRIKPNTGTDTIDYLLDEAHNRAQVTGGADPGAYTYDPTLPEPADLEMNQATATPFDARSYDAAGNLIRATSGTGGTDDLRFDYANRLIEHKDGASGTTFFFDYDALGRRIALRTQGGTTTNFCYHGWKVIEEQDGAGATLATYVHGARNDEMVQMRRAGALSYYLGDDQQSVVALDNGAGSILERYEYEDYGGVVNVTPPVAGNPWLFTGQRFDAPTGLYFFKRRYLDPRAGRFITRDPLGIWADASMLGNPTAYAGNNPWSRVDSSGLDWERSEYCSSTGDTLLTRFDDCDSSDRRTELEDRLCDAYEGAEDGHSDALEYVNGTASTDEEEDLEDWFHEDGFNLSDGEVEDVHDVMHDVYYEFQDDRIEFECETSSHNTCEDGANAFTNGSDNNLHLCNRYWTSGFSDEEQAAIIYHEATHEWGGTDDEAYIWEASYSSLSTSELINNADTYEEYLQAIHMP